MSTQTVFKTAGSTSQTIDVALVQKAAATSPGDPITGLAFNTSSLTAYYRKGATGTLTSITLATQTVGGAYSSGGFVEISSTNAPGLYRFDIPDTVIASAGIASVTFTGAANMATHTVYIVVTAVDLYDSVRGGMTALPNAAAGAAGGLPIDVATGANYNFGILDEGTAQAATSTTLQLRSAAAFADSELVGATILITGGSAGVGQSRIITAYTGSTDTATVDAWTTTPTGTITYKVFATPPASSGSPVAANVTKWNGTNVASPATAGIPEVNVKNINNVAASSVTAVNANVGTTQPVNFTGTGASALAKSDMVDVAGAAVSTSSAQLGVNVVNAGGTAWGSGAITAASIAANAITAAKVATDAIGAAQVAADAVTEIQSGLSTLNAAGVRSAVGLASANLDTQLAAVATPAQILTTALTESYAADGAAGTLSQILFGIQAFLQERTVSGTTCTVKKLDGSTTAMVFTLNDATTPTSLTRTT